MARELALTCVEPRQPVRLLASVDGRAEEHALVRNVGAHVRDAVLLRHRSVEVLGLGKELLRRVLEVDRAVDVLWCVPQVDAVLIVHRVTARPATHTHTHTHTHSQAQPHASEPRWTARTVDTGR